MKFCTSCGSELKDGASFCTNCGATQVAQSQQKQESGLKKFIASLKSKLMAGNKPKLPIAIGAVAIVLLIAGICVFGGDENSLGTLKPENFKIYKNEKWGLMNKKGKVIVEPKYDLIDDMYEGLAAVRVDGDWGYIDAKDKMVINPNFDSAGAFNEGVAPVSMGYKKWGLINKKGEFVVMPQYESVSSVMEGLALVKKDGKYGYINAKGKVVIDIKYDFATQFVNGYAIVQEGENTFYINKKGKNKFKQNFSDANFFSEGLALVTMKNGESAYIDTSGKAILKYVTGGRFSDGLAPAYDTKQDKFGYINENGDFKIKAEFDRNGEFSEGLAAIKKDGKVGYINKKGKVVIEPEFKNAQPFLNGVARVETENGWGYINKKGKMLWENKQ